MSGRRIGRGCVDGWADYIAFRRRALHRMAELASLHEIDEDGVVGAVATSGQPRGGLLALAGADEDALFGLLTRTSPIWVALLLPPAELVERLALAGWGLRQQQWAMALPDLADLQPVPWPAGIEVREAAVRPAAEGLPLAEVLSVEVEHRRDDVPGPVRDIELEARMLRELSVRFFGALNPSGACVATAGCRVVDGSALVAAVVTVPEYRRRGIATAMTRHVLDTARADGATEAFLDATDAGVGIYTRLGFCRLGQIVYVERHAGPEKPVARGGTTRA